MYELDLPNNMRIIWICYVLVLELADPEALFMENILDINPKS